MEVAITLPVCDTDTVPVLELVALSESLGVVDKRGDGDTEVLGVTDSDSAPLVDAKAVPEGLDVVDTLEVTEADPESL